MMTAVASHLFLPELISKMPPGSATDILYGELTGQHICMYTFCIFPFISCFGLV